MASPRELAKFLVDMERHFLVLLLAHVPGSLLLLDETWIRTSRWRTTWSSACAEFDLAPAAPEARY